MSQMKYTGPLVEKGLTPLEVELLEALKTILDFVDSGGLGTEINANAKATLEQYASKAIAKAGVI